MKVLKRQFRCFWLAVCGPVPCPYPGPVIASDDELFSFSFCCALPKVWLFFFTFQAAQHGSMQLHTTQKALAVSVSGRKAYMHVFVSLCNDT